MKLAIIAAIAAFISVNASCGQKSHSTVKLVDADNADTVNFPVDRTDLNFEISIGKRNLDWIKAINQARGGKHVLDLYSKETLVVHPIDQPLKSSGRLIAKRFLDLEKELPYPMTKILFTTGPLPSQHPFATDAEFLKWSRQVDEVYMQSTRWVSVLKKNLKNLYKASVKDIRGYYYLSREKDIEAKLDNWSGLTKEQYVNMKTWLMSICRNSGQSNALCDAELTKAAAEHTILLFYDKYMPYAKVLFDSLFNLARANLNDGRWINDHLMSFSFQLPEDEVSAEQFKTAVESMWRTSEWKLQLNFGEGSHLPRLSFKEGVTPQADTVAGKSITMDANRGLNSYFEMWGLAHEFGHILGFPDCYVEFYSLEENAVIQYNIDLDNIMCSRRGSVNASHYASLKHAYGGR